MLITVFKNVDFIADMSHIFLHFHYVTVWQYIIQNQDASGEVAATLASIAAT